MNNNLWGNLIDLKEEFNNPKDILLEQAGFLEKSLDGLIKGKVGSKNVLSDWKDFFEDLKVDTDFNYTLSIYSDYIEKYSYTICEIVYGIKMYPLAILLNEEIIEEMGEEFVVEDGDTIVIKNEEMFYQILEKVFNSKEVHEVLRGLISIAQKEKDSLPW